MNDPPLNFEVSIFVGTLAVKLSVPWVNDPPENDPLVNDPPLNLEVSITAGVLAVNVSVPCLNEAAVPLVLEPTLVIEYTLVVLGLIVTADFALLPDGV